MRIVILISMLILFACGDGDSSTGPDDGGGDPAVASVSLAPAEPVIEVGETVQLDADVRSDAGAALDVPVTWSTSDAEVASVDGDGRVAGVSAGEATVEARAGGVTGSTRVSVDDDRLPVERAADDATKVLEEVLPAPGTPLEQRNPVSELKAVADRLLDIDGVLAVKTNRTGLTAQAVLSDGTSLLFIHNRFDGAADAGSARSPQLVHRVGTRPEPTPPSSPEAVVVAIDGGASVAKEAHAMLSEAGYAASTLAGTLEEMRGFKQVGALHLDTHGATYNQAAIIDEGGSEPTVKLGETRYALQTSTVVSGDEGLASIRDAFVEGDLALSVSMDDDGEASAKIAITDQFIARHWSFDEGVVVLHACFGGATTFTTDGPCTGSCDASDAGVFDATPLRQAMLDAGADVIMSFDNYTASNEARPSILYFWDRLLGADTFQPKRPPLRPFPGDKVVNAMRLDGLDRFERPTYLAGFEVGTSGTVNVTFDGDLDDAQLAPTIRELDVIDDAASESATLHLFGDFGQEPGEVRVAGSAVPIEAWGAEQVIARPPFAGSGDVVVAAPSGVTSNRVPVTRWQGPIELQFYPDGPGSLLATANVDAVFRADVHEYRTEVFDEPDPQAATSYLSPASDGRAIGQGERINGSIRTTYYGQKSLRVLGKQAVDVGGGVANSVGGYLELDPESGAGQLCMWFLATVNIREEQDGEVYEEEAPLLVMPEDLWTDPGILGCVDVTVGDDYTISSGSHRDSEGNLNYEFSWGPLVPTSAPDEETAG